MPVFQNSTFRNETIELDGKEFEGCRFENCYLIYRATAPMTLTNCSFLGFTITLEDAAANTLDFLTALYHGGFQSTIEQTFNNVRTRNVPSGGWTIH
jgi:hypothetical protein